jgi:hypothetical protein
MKIVKIFGLSLLVLVTTACGVTVQNVQWEKTKMYEIYKCSGEGSCYFQYPSSAAITEEVGTVFISNDACQVNFGENMMAEKEKYNVKTSKNGNHLSESWFLGNKMAAYIAGFEGKSYKFWVFDAAGDVSQCVIFVDELANSFTDKPTYFNDQYSFSAAILPDYKVEYLKDNAGIVMTRQVAGEELKAIIDNEWKTWPTGTKNVPDPMPYMVEIGIEAKENILGYKNLGEYVKSECADCSTEFLENGVLVNVQQRKFSERVFLAMSDDKNTIYRAYLRLLNYRYKYHQKGYDEWVKSIEIF